MFLVTICSFPFWGELDISNITTSLLTFFVVDIVVATIYNILFYRAVSGEKMANVEPIIMTHPLASMLIAIIAFPSERNWLIVIPGAIAAFALIVSRVERHHLKLNKYMIFALLAVLLMGIEGSLVKVMTGYIDPLMLYTLRIGTLSLVLALVLKPSIKQIGEKRLKSIAFVSVVLAVEMLLWFYAISAIGVVKTSLILLLGPVLVLLGSKFYLGDTIKPKAAIADVIIIICIASAILIS
jgi:uncharacterized membrane protein